jgi:hypothetical protein
MDTVGLRVPTTQIRDISTFNVSIVSRLSPSTRRVTAANICRCLDVLNKQNIHLEDTFSFVLWYFGRQHNNKNKPI